MFDIQVDVEVEIFQCRCIERKAPLTCLGSSDQ